ncbi:hypothetical protein PAECIP111894_05969 [Paenibacillus pseudetheri]|uniref:Uncharacterized protein n=1 Tax=Paenibacillus pseudetheri TaxID=2897682 RepID=A0ABM9BL06_9BACL|nr:hypothetical protein PAECIP111894_05969 [Paenibacillus pseudetheri]
MSGKVKMDQKGGDVPEALQEDTASSLQESVIYLKNGMAMAMDEFNMRSLHVL